jgi:dihydropteroate synthase
MHLWRLGKTLLQWQERPLILGIVNVTPDSFSDGGQYLGADRAIEHARALVRDGADLIDIGGESTRPGAEPVPLEDELGRVVPVVKALAGLITVPISIDTYKAEVARQCLQAGARIVNDVTGLMGDPEMIEVVRRTGAGAIVMHMQGTPQTMQLSPQYDDVVGEISRFLEDRLQSFVNQGIDRQQIVLDPGLGFGKSGAHNWQLLSRLEQFQRLERPVCLGVSRKGFIGKLIGRGVQESLAGSLAVACVAACKGAAQVLRVHDVKETRDALLVVERMGSK